MIWPMKPIVLHSGQQRTLPIPVRVGADIFVEMPDGERKKVEPLTAQIHALAWAQAVQGAYVYLMTTPKEDDL